MPGKRLAGVQDIEDDVGQRIAIPVQRRLFEAALEKRHQGRPVVNAPNHGGAGKGVGRHEGAGPVEEHALGMGRRLVAQEPESVVCQKARQDRASDVVQLLPAMGHERLIILAPRRVDRVAVEVHQRGNLAASRFSAHDGGPRLAEFP
jgi:hypothetical protein